MNAELVIDGVEYRKVSTSGEQLSIVICDNRGLTFVGFCDLSGDAEFVVIHKARCIIRWGTTSHIAELCGGPTSSTTLGAIADVSVPRRNIVAVYEAKGDWYA